MRTFEKLGVVILTLVLIVACAPSTPTAAPTKPPAAPAAPTAASAPAPTTAAAAPTKPAAPAASPTPAVKIKRGGILVSSVNTALPSLDPLFDIRGTNLKEVALYEAMLRYEVTDLKEGKLEIKPELAESWQVVDPKTVVLKLRKGVKFHDGSDFNAEVAKWSLERMGSHPKSLSKRLAENFASLEVIDPYTLKINYKNPSGLNLLNLTAATAGTGSVGSVILSKAHMDKVGEETFSSQPSGTGPMKVAEWKRDDVLVVTRFDGYWGDGADGKKLPYLDGMRQRFVTDNAVIQTELKAGTMHITRSLSPSDLAAIKANPDLDVILMKWAPIPHYFGFNQEKEPFGKNLKLRQAVQYATDRETMARVLGMEAGVPNYYLGWTPGWVGYDEKLPRYEFNLDKAIALVKEAGYPNGVDLVLLHYVPTLDRRKAEMLQSMWGKAGVRATLDSGEATSARQKIKAGEFESHTWNMAYSPDPAHFNRMYTCEGAANWSNYCNREVDKCMLEGERETDTAKRVGIYNRCQRMMYEDALVGGLWQVSPVLTFRKEVKGIKIQAASEDYQEIWLDK
ncbi:MAG: ABC transporter substrate-binding protein [Bacteroidetes bacterium]|nr:ABC transporter substrate-binding protein [Bacteroidota bacterium]MCL5027340.1 ABC transporter substrate-binding protein [Chloroflexota bacterium]